jgi:hypothetical protein
MISALIGFVTRSQLEGGTWKNKHLRSMMVGGKWAFRGAGRGGRLQGAEDALGRSFILST